MSNVAGKTYGMNVVTPMRPRMTWINRFIFMLSRALPSTLSGLLGLSLIHFARWVFIKRDQWPDRGQGQQKLTNDYMLFCSNFNGTWDQYIDAFADGIPGGLDLFWYSSTKYPNSIPITPFKTYIRANQIDTNYYYNATPGSAQRDIKLALKLKASLLRVDAQGDDKALAAAFQSVLLEVQSGLGAPGYGPIASCDTSAADLHRCEAVRARWGPKAAGPPPAVHVIHGVAPEIIAPEPTALESVSDGAAAPAEEEREQAAVRAAIAKVVAAPSRVDEAPKLMPVEVAPQPPAAEPVDAPRAEEKPDA
jgi:hypothetical protein